MPSAPLPGLSLLLPRAPVQGWALVPAVHFFLKGGASCPDLLNPGKSLNGEKGPLGTGLEFLRKSRSFFPSHYHSLTKASLKAGQPWRTSLRLGAELWARESRFLERRWVLLARIPLGQDFVLILVFFVFFSFFFLFCPPSWVRPTQLKLWQSLLSHEFIL